MKRFAIATMMMAVLASAGSAEAARIRIEDLGTGTGIVLTDNGAGDANPVLGALTFVGGVGGFVVNVTTGLSQPLTVPGSIDLNSVNINTNGAAQLRITFEDTDFDSAAGLIQMVLGGVLSGPPGSTVTFQGWANIDNLVPALGTDQAVGPIGAIGAIPAGSTLACTFVAATGAFANSCESPFLGDAQYSLFAQVLINLTGPGSVSFDQELFATVPEPGTMMLLGTGLLGLAAAARRRQAKR